MMGLSVRLDLFLSVGSFSYPLLSGIISSRYPSSVVSFDPESCALSFDKIDFPLSKPMARETKDFQNVLGDLLKCSQKGEHPMNGCFVDRRFEMILSIAAFKVGLALLDDIAKTFALTV